MLLRLPDMDETVSRRSGPSSRTALMGEQPNPWTTAQVAMSRHQVPNLRVDVTLGGDQPVIPRVTFIR